MGITVPKRRGISKIPHPHTAHLPYLPEPPQWLWPFCMPISGSVIFRECRFNLLYNIGGGLEKCSIVLHRAGGWCKNTIFALYNMWTAPYSIHADYGCVLVLGYAGGNLALNKPASQSSTDLSAVASLAVDGQQDTRSCTNSNLHPWLSVDLEAAYDVGHVTVINDMNAPFGNYRQLVCLTKHKQTVCREWHKQWLL